MQVKNVIAFNAPKSLGEASSKSMLLLQRANVRVHVSRQQRTQTSGKGGKFLRFRFRFRTKLFTFSYKMFPYPRNFFMTFFACSYFTPFGGPLLIRRACNATIRLKGGDLGIFPVLHIYTAISSLKGHTIQSNSVGNHCRIDPLGSAYVIRPGQLTEMSQSI